MMRPRPRADSDRAMTDATPHPGRYDADAVEKAVRDLLIAVGEDPGRAGLQDTPARLARSYAEIFAGLYLEPSDVLGTTFEIGHEEMVVVKDLSLIHIS